MTLSELRQTPHLSASSIGDYIECSLLYKLGRVDRLPMEYKADALEYGTVMHIVLGEYYQEKMIGNKMLLKDIHQSFEEQWTRVAKGRKDIKYAKGKDFETLLMDGKDLLTAWYMNLKEDNYTVLSIEEPFGFYVPGIDVPIIGATDLREEDEAGTIIITDFKTSGRAYSIDEVDNNFQMLIYYMAERSNGHRNREILLKFDTLIKTKKPRYEEYYTVRSENDELRAIRKIQAVYRGIQNEVFIPNDTSWRCKNCSYKTACNEWFAGRAA